VKRTFHRAENDRQQTVPTVKGSAGGPSANGMIGAAACLAMA
jgi:hypothetical protein